MQAAGATDAAGTECTVNLVGVFAVTNGFYCSAMPICKDQSTTSAHPGGAGTSFAMACLPSLCPSDKKRETIRAKREQKTKQKL